MSFKDINMNKYFRVHPFINGFKNKFSRKTSASNFYTMQENNHTLTTTFRMLSKLNGVVVLSFMFYARNLIKHLL